MAYITKRDNRWRAMIRRTGHPSQSKTFTTKGAAEAWARKIESEIDAGKIGTIPEYSLAELIDRYIDEVSINKPIGRTKRSTLNFLKQEIGMVTNKEFSKEFLLNYVLRRMESGAGGVTVSIDLTYLKSVFTIAERVWDMPFDLEMFDAARTSMMHLGISTRSAKRSRRVSDDELKMIMQHFDNQPRSKQPYSDIILFAVATAMRASEIVGIRWDDLNVERKTIIIRDRKHPTEKFGNDQEVPLINGSFEILMRQKRHEAEPRIFPLGEGTLSSVFPRAVQKLGLEDIRFHDLRHEGVSRLFDAGYSIEQVSLLSGHRSWQMLKRYTHLSPTAVHSFAAERPSILPRPVHQQSEGAQS
jgi:integrase